MPHDCNAVELKVGDPVRIIGRVVEIYPGSETCNVTVKVIEPGHVPQGTFYIVCLTASQVQKLDYEPCPHCGEDGSDCACADCADGSSDDGEQ
jgi:hypothetical protein